MNQIFLAVMVFVIMVLLNHHKANAQSITLEWVNVFANADESAAEGLGILLVEVKWELSPGLPADMIIRIHKYIDGIVYYQPIDEITVGSSSNNNWGDPFADIHNRSERYWLELLDQSGNAITSTEVHSTIFLQQLIPAMIDECERNIMLRWSNYQITDNVFDNPLSIPFTHNRIMVLPPGGAEYMAAELSIDETEYELPFEYGPGMYRIRVRSVEIELATGNVVRESNSNARYIPYDRPALTDIQIISVDVEDQQTVSIAFEVVENAPGDALEFEYKIFRSNDLNGDYEQLGNAGWDAAEVRYVYTDTNDPAPNDGPVFYQVRAHLPGCEGEFDIESDIVSSLFLKGEIITYDETQLIIGFDWEHYPDPGASNFRLYRMLSGGAGFSLVGSAPGAVPDDDLSSMIETVAGEIQYYIEADFGTETIRSNIISVFIETELIIPNAFRPDSEIDDNRYFRPGFKGQTPVYYRLVIYNRWGQEILPVENPGSTWPGWDGTGDNGNDMPQGVYGFRFEYQIGSNAREETVGTVILVR